MKVIYIFGGVYFSNIHYMINFNFCSCWSKDPALRPSMNTVKDTMEDLITMFTGYDIPVKYADESEDFGVCLKFHSI